MSADTLRQLLEEAAGDDRWLTRAEMATELRKRFGMHFTAGDMVGWMVEIQKSGCGSIERRTRGDQVEYKLHA
jgi:hypothetical protein